MSHTKRIYNKAPLIGDRRFKGWISSQKLESEDLALRKEDKGLSFAKWIGYHPHRQFDDVSPLERWGNSRGGWHSWLRKDVLPIWIRRRKNQLKRYLKLEVDNYYQNAPEI